MQDLTSRSSRGRRRRRLAGWVCAVSSAALLGGAPASHADEYDPKQAGHPLRVVAYALHPVGVTLDYLIMRPMFWLGSHEPLRTLFGRGD